MIFFTGDRAVLNGRLAILAGCNFAHRAAQALSSVLSATPLALEEQAVVTIRDGETYTALYGEEVVASTGSIVFAHGGSTIHACAGSTVHAYAGARVISMCGATVFGYHDSIICNQGGCITCVGNAEVVDKLPYF